MPRAKESKRNYESEHKWAAQRYKRFEAKLVYEMGEEFAQFLADQNINFTDWVRKNYQQQRGNRNG
jgi:hypothetical protein